MSPLKASEEDLDTEGEGNEPILPELFAAVGKFIPYIRSEDSRIGTPKSEDQETETPGTDLLKDDALLRTSGEEGGWL